MDLIREISGPYPGGIYIRNGQLSSQIWSPYWRSEVDREKLHTHFGVMGKSCILWPSIPETIYVFHDIEIISKDLDKDISIDALEKILIDHNVNIYLRSYSLPDPIEYEIIKVRVFDDDEKFHIVNEVNNPPEPPVNYNNFTDLNGNKIKTNIWTKNSKFN